MKEMELELEEFIRRFSLHILPCGFVRIRHYGILSSSTKKVSIPTIRSQLGTTDICFIETEKVRSFDNRICPQCGKPTMLTVEVIATRGPPPTNDWVFTDKKQHMRS